jgi:hypothetical protein
MAEIVSLKTAVAGSRFRARVADDLAVTSPPSDQELVALCALRTKGTAE